MLLLFGVAEAVGSEEGEECEDEANEEKDTAGNGLVVEHILHALEAV